jgi:hypothetical protein
MLQSYKGPSKFFPRLNIDVLNVHAKRWAAQYPDVPIDRIVLYNYASKFQKHYDKPIKYKKYAVVFEISCEDKLYGLPGEKLLKYDLAVVNNEITPDPYYCFVKDLEIDTSIFPGKMFKALITEDFTNVYWEKPEDTFRNEWIFFSRPLVYNPERKKIMPMGLPVNVRVNEPHIILFQAEEDIGQEEHSDKSKIRDLMIRAQPELEKLHQTLLKKVSFSGHVEDREKKFQGSALNRFKENSNEFEYVKLEYLRDKTLYDFYRPGQEKGDFTGKLLQKILKDHGLGDHGFQKLYEIYKDALKSKTD